MAAVDEPACDTATMVSEEAGVALKTIYVYFPTKAGVVRALSDARLGGDEADLPVLEREWYRAVVDEPDPERKLRLVAAQSRRVKSRSGALLEMIRAAAPADPDIATLWSDIEAKLLDVQRSIVEQLHARGSLASSLDVTRATDVLWTLNHPAVWQLLVVGRGWTDEQYERWLGDAFCSQLLDGRRVPAVNERRSQPANAGRAYPLHSRRPACHWRLPQPSSKPSKGS
jgi:AcrR family transcriptional regulator